MANIGVGETFRAYLVKATDITQVDSFIKSVSPTETLMSCEVATPFRYRYLDARESLVQALPVWLKAKLDSTMFTSDTDINPEADDIVFDEYGKRFMIVNVLPQRQLGFYAFNKKFPKVLELQ